MFKPNTTVALIVKCEDKFLIVEETEFGKQVINQPAGHLEKDESLIDAAKRELLEETGIEAEPQALVGIYQSEVTDKNIQYLRFCFLIELDGSCPITAPQDSDIDAAIWLTWPEIQAQASRHRSHMVSICVQDYLAGRRYPLDILSFC